MNVEASAEKIVQPVSYERERYADSMEVLAAAENALSALKYPQEKSSVSLRRVDITDQKKWEDLVQTAAKPIQSDLEKDKALICVSADVVVMVGKPDTCIFEIVVDYTGSNNLTLSRYIAFHAQYEKWVDGEKIRAGQERSRTVQEVRDMIIAMLQKYIEDSKAELFNPKTNV